MSEIVLLSVLKYRADLKYLLKDRWYRIPVESCPKKKFSRIAFYEPGMNGKVRYHAKVSSVRPAVRAELLPRSADPEKKYFKFSFRRVAKLKNAIKNKNGIRVSFGYTVFSKLKKAKEVTDLFGVVPIEKLIKKELQRLRIKHSSEFRITLPKESRYRLDFALFCVRKPLNVECDSLKWHSQKAQVFKDKYRDKVLKKQGWSILRLKEKEIASNINGCIDKINRRVKTLGGLKG